MATATLPPNLQSKLDTLAGRLHRLRLMRGISWVVLSAVIGAGLIFALDAWMELPPPVRCILAAGLIGTVAFTAWRYLIRPIRFPVTSAGLAAAVEEEYPRLGERLMSSVELADAEITHGSPAFVRMLVNETEQTTRALDFRRAAQPHATEWLTACSVAALLLLALPAVLIPEYYFGLGRRLLMPWDRRPAVLPFAIETTPGDIYTARGRPLTITAELRPLRERTSAPEVCTLVMSTSDGKSLRLRMPAGSKPHEFAFRMDEVKTDFRYRIEAGQLETDTHTIMAVDPVELAGGPTATLTPPAYAKAIGLQTVDGPADLTVLEHGQVAIDCRFDRPAESATLIVTPLTPADATPQRRPLTLSEDKQSGRIEIAARSGAKLRLELAAGHDIITVTPEQILTVTPDRPPEIHRAGGLPDHGSVRPTDTLSLDLAVADDLAVAALEIEYRVNEGPVLHEPVPLAGLGTPVVAGRFDFKLAGKVKDGDKLSVRVRAFDNRSVPEFNLGPNVVTYPPGDHWSELRVASDADSVRQQEVTAKRDDIDKRLHELIARVDHDVRRTYALHQNIEQSKVTAAEQTKSVRELAEEQSALDKVLTELAGDAAVAGLKPIADKMKAVVEQEFRQAAEAFRDAGVATDKGRVPPLRKADTALTEARTKLESLLKDNRDLADARLDEVKLNELAERERELAEQAKATLTPEEKEKLAKEQERLAEELKKLTENDPSLRDSLDAARAEEARKLAEQARKLAQAERDLDAKLAEAQRQRDLVKLGNLADKQEALASDAIELALQTQNATQTAKTQPLDAQPAAKAAEDLRKGDAEDALAKQDQSAQELERIAESLQKGIETAKDPREAAQQLSRLQEENRKRLVEKPAERPVARQQQETIQKAVENLKIPEDNGAARRDRQQAAELSAEAARALNRNDQANAEFRMGQAKEALDRLANDLPTAENRARRARDEVARLREAQEEIRKLADKAAKTAEKGERQAASDERAEAARKQADVADKLAKLDAPGQETRRERATKAAARAEDDLQNSKSPDVNASQADAKRTLERLAEALAGQTPADDKARELAKQERELAKAAAKATGDKAAQAALQRRQEKVAKDTQELKATEAPLRQDQATNAAIQANIALRDKPDNIDTLQKMRDAADKLDALADQLTGRESETERADRLAKTQEAAAKQPSANPIDAKRQANQLAGEAQQMRAGEKAAAAKKDATDALQRLQRTNPDTPENAQAQKDAAQALRRLADQMKQDRADNTQTRPEDLARQERELARETDSAQKQNQSLQKLAERQEQLRQQANRLPTEQAPKAVQQARQAMQQAEQALERQYGAQAAQQQKQAADALDKAARQIAKATAGQQSGQPTPDGMPSPEQVGQARELAKRQRDLQDQVRRATADDAATADERAAANRQQQDLAQKAGDLAKSLDQQAGNMPGQQAKQSAQGAAASARQGEQSLQQAQGENPGQARQARKQASDALDRAAGQAEQAARASQPGQGQPGAQQAGQKIQDAQGQMGQAQNQLGQGQPQQASGSMQRAADALQDAAKQVGQNSNPQGPPNGATQPATVATQGKGDPTSHDLPKELQKHAGKKWGELPGELRTRIVQDMKAQYGDDYARVIKLYFEQIAESGGKK